MRLELDILAQTESLFALANGHIGLRGNLDEGEPYGLPGTYLNSFYEQRPLAYVEPGYGYPESGQTVINVTNGKLIRLLVDDAPFDVRYGRLEKHSRNAVSARRKSLSGSSVSTRSASASAHSKKARSFASVSDCSGVLLRSRRVQVTFPPGPSKVSSIG